MSLIALIGRYLIQAEGECVSSSIYPMSGMGNGHGIHL
jgi:hypothetical protein